MNWLYPLAVTVLAIGAAIWIHHRGRPIREVELAIQSIIYLIAIIVSLVAWLVWAVVT